MPVSREKNRMRSLSEYPDEVVNGVDDPVSLGDSKGSSGEKTILHINAQQDIMFFEGHGTGGLGGHQMPPAWVFIVLHYYTGNDICQKEPFRRMLISPCIIIRKQDIIVSNFCVFGGEFQYD
jgi:hypothetical protein